MARAWEFWIDRGGTFTDVVAQHPDGSLHTHKLLSENPERYPDAAVQGIREILGLTDGEQLPDATINAVKMGTTVATNALLERKGERTLFLITAGFGDLLRIGYQTRPRLFDLHIKRSELLYERVGEVPERLDADGSVLTELDENTTRTLLQQAFDDGFRSVAIAFLHGYLNPQHEARTAEIARQIGFTQVSASHQVSRLAKLVGRGDTTVVDAYLSPILRRYVDQVAGALDVGRACGKLLFMQSNGGLTDARLFQGKDAILSGPAGGIVGMVETGQAAGIRQTHRFRYGRYLNRCQPFRRGFRALVRNRDRGRSDAGADDGYPHGCCWRRVDLHLSRWQVSGGTRKRRRGSRSCVLPPWRAADGYGLQCDAGQAAAGSFPACLRC